MTADSRKIIRCHQCRRRSRLNAPESERWNFTLRRGVVTDWTCPDCQTPEENAEAEVNLATLNYGRLPDGRIVGRSKSPMPAPRGAS